MLDLKNWIENLKIGFEKLKFLAFGWSVSGSGPIQIYQRRSPAEISRIWRRSNRRRCGRFGKRSRKFIRRFAAKNWRNWKNYQRQLNYNTNFIYLLMEKLRYKVNKMLSCQFFFFYFVEIQNFFHLIDKNFFWFDRIQNFFWFGWNLKFYSKFRIFFI